MYNVEKEIPHPKLQKLSGTSLDKPWYQRVYLYVSEPVKYKFIEDWYILLPNGIQIMIPKGEVTDGASIPWFLKPFASSFGSLSRGAYLHDFGYKHGYLFNWIGSKIPVLQKRKEIDRLFRDVVIITTEFYLLAYWAWSGVRTFGFFPWNKHRSKR